MRNGSSILKPLCGRPQCHPFFNAGLLYLCFEHLDNFGAYSASSVTTTCQPIQF